MDFNDTPEEAAYRAQVQAWLKENAPAHEINLLDDSLTDDEIMDRGMAWQARKADAGYGAILWPKEYGGAAGTIVQHIIFHDEQSKYALPIGNFSGCGTGLAIPTMMAHGTKEQLDTYAPPTLRGELRWCQLFSEPSAGSDLAGLRTRAVKDGDHWVVNGQKVWNSWAHKADLGILIVRTDPSVPKHKGLTYFIVDMNTPGIEVRPIRQISGRSEFSEVFFTDVRIPDSMRIGELGDGWRVTMTTLMNERANSGGGRDEHVSVSRLMKLAREIETGNGRAIEDSATREKIARFYGREQGLKYFKYRMSTKLSHGEQPGPEAAISKYIHGKLLQNMAQMGLELKDYQGLIGGDDGPADNAMLHDSFLWSIVMRVAGGTDEVVLNQVGERVLGMPAEIRVDKDIPFNELPSGK